MCALLLQLPISQVIRGAAATPRTPRFKGLLRSRGWLVLADQAGTRPHSSGRHGGEAMRCDAACADDGCAMARLRGAAARQSNHQREVHIVHMRSMVLLAGGHQPRGGGAVRFALRRCCSTYSCRVLGVVVMNMQLTFTGCAVG
ncbi:hypothetical protein GQ54DRAFT_73419 [Martensiomyces pterosporus]|nr:hypothetical protein GQ54DRAFT_73419 [Martensiomyces pterosporus]